MEKLIDLLNEYSGKEFWSLSGGAIESDEDSDAYKYLDTFIISKKFGFIKRLVENDKIKAEYVFENLAVDSIIMQLAISDTPLNDLFTLLK